MSLWLFNVHMDGVVRQVNVMVLWKGLEFQSGVQCEWWQVCDKPAVICR